MNFQLKTRKSESPFVDAIWQTEDTANGTYLAAATGVWEMLLTTYNNKTHLRLSGPSSHARPVDYKKGSRNLGIRFKPGVFIPSRLTPAMVNTVTTTAATAQTLCLEQTMLETPTFDNADDFIARLASLGLLTKDHIVERSLAQEPTHLSPRSLQRHFLQATGITPMHHQQIKRAHQAVALLQAGQAISDVVYHLGYADQAHMTRIVKFISGCTPGQIVRKLEACRLRSIQGYGPCAKMKVQNFKGGIHDKALQN